MILCSSRKYAVYFAFPKRSDVISEECPPLSSHSFKLTCLYFVIRAAFDVKPYSQQLAERKKILKTGGLHSKTQEGVTELNLIFNLS